MNLWEMSESRGICLNIKSINCNVVTKRNYAGAYLLVTSFFTLVFFFSTNKKIKLVDFLNLVFPSVAKIRTIT